MRIACAVLAIMMSQHHGVYAQSLEELIHAARENNLELREQAALVAEAEAVTRVERSPLYPAVEVRGGYRYNPKEVIVAGSVFAAEHQYDTVVALDIPLFDVATRGRSIAAAADANVRRASAAIAAVAVERAVVRAYYQWVGGSALVRAAGLAERTAEDSVAAVERRRTSGFASDVDVARSRADVARARQRLADAQLSVATARRQIRTLTGRDLRDDAPMLPDDAGPEAPLDAWSGQIAQLPEVRAAAAAHAGTTIAAARAASGLLPRLDVISNTVISNAPGFFPKAYWFAGLTATWTLDLRAVRTRRVVEARERISAIRLSIAERDARDRLTDAWNVVEAKRAGVMAASVELVAAREALEFAKSRIEAGLARPIELLDAQREAFSAEIAEVQARANLAAARALLRLAAGREVTR